MNITNDNRATVLSFRAKLRKAMALPVAEEVTTAAERKSIEGLLRKLDAALAPRKTAAKKKTGSKKAVTKQGATLGSKETKKAA